MRGLGLGVVVAQSAEVLDWATETSVEHYVLLGELHAAKCVASQVRIPPSASAVHQEIVHLHSDERRGCIGKKTVHTNTVTAEPDLGVRNQPPRT